MGLSLYTPHKVGTVRIDLKLIEPQEMKSVIFSQISNDFYDDVPHRG